MSIVDRVRSVFNKYVADLLADGFIIEPFSLSDKIPSVLMHIDLIRKRTTARVYVTLDENRNYVVIVGKHTQGYAPYIRTEQLTEMHRTVIV